VGAYTQDNWSADFTGQLRSSNITRCTTRTRTRCRTSLLWGYDAFEGRPPCRSTPPRCHTRVPGWILLPSRSRTVNGNCTSGVLTISWYSSRYLDPRRRSEGGAGTGNAGTSGIGAAAGRRDAAACTIEVRPRLLEMGRPIYVRVRGAAGGGLP
jgi:hypothetical protein